MSKKREPVFGKESCGSVSGPGVWFLLKSLLILAVVFFMASRERQPEGQGGAKAKVETARRAAPAAPHEGDAIETLRKAAAQKLADGVRDQCLKRPEDCLSVVNTVGAGLSSLNKPR
jgi:hypothetical protein